MSCWAHHPPLACGALAAAAVLTAAGAAPQQWRQQQQQHDQQQQHHQASGLPALHALLARSSSSTRSGGSCGAAAAGAPSQPHAATPRGSWLARLAAGAAGAGLAPRLVACADAQPQPQPQSAGMAEWQAQQAAQQAAQASWSQQWARSGEPLSGAIPELRDDGLTNHPLDYSPITNEHTAAMTLAKQAALDAYQAGRYAEAELRFKEALDEALLGFPPGDAHIPCATHALAELYRHTRRYDEAEALYRQAIDQLADSLGERHWMYSAALTSLASLHQARREHAQALELLERALELRRQLFSEGSYLYADTAALLAAALMAAHNDAAAAAAAAASDGAAPSTGGSSGGGGWLRSLLGGGSKAAAAPAVDVSRAIQLWSRSIGIVEDAGTVEGSPIVPWLLDLAAAQTTAQRHADAVVSLKKALHYMSLPPQTEQEQQQQPQQEQQQPQQAGAAAPAADGGGVDAVSAAVAAAGGNPAAARLRLSALASEVSERLVDAQLAAGDLPGARESLRAALEARMALLGRHLLVAKTMTRLARLLMAPPPDPAAQQLAPHFASSAVAIADAALQGAQRANVWMGTLRGALQALASSQQAGSYKARTKAEHSSERVLAALQLGNASLALAAAQEMNGQPGEAEAALRHAVTTLRWVLIAGGDDLRELTAADAAAVEPALLQRVAGLLVDLKLLQMDCLEALASVLREAAGSAGAAAPAGAGASRPAMAPVPPAAAAPPVAAADEDEVRMLLCEAELLAAELYGD